MYFCDVACDRCLLRLVLLLAPGRLWSKLMTFDYIAFTHVNCVLHCSKLGGSRLDPSRSAKLLFSFGPFRIRSACDNGSYLLEGLDGTGFYKAIHGNRLEGYFSRAEHEVGDEEMERMLTARDQSEEIETERRW